MVEKNVTGITAAELSENIMAVVCATGKLQTLDVFAQFVIRPKRGCLCDWSLSFRRRPFACFRTLFTFARAGAEFVRASYSGTHDRLPSCAVAQRLKIVRQRFVSGVSRRGSFGQVRLDRLVLVLRNRIAVVQPSHTNAACWWDSTLSVCVSIRHRDPPSARTCRQKPVGRAYLLWKFHGCLTATI